MTFAIFAFQNKVIIKNVLLIKFMRNDFTMTTHLVQLYAHTKDV